ncbi:MAG: hypothetical protein AB1704_26035 [Pseudomonadota bacterium]|uniref:hypothetical protein n=1 Tax=Burkholderiaceae TaxID=119060 RepID=UPI0010F62231|nr:hypothetical protein [Burkholderia sp. 4M9327F10]
MLGHTNATNATFDELAGAEWFSAVGNSATDKVLRVHSWAEAIEQVSSLDWENLRLEAANQLRSRILEVAPGRFQQWNAIIRRMKLVSEPLVREKTASVVAFNQLPTAFEQTVHWDILHLLMEAEHADIVPPGFYAAQGYWYVAGRFPCGWAGAFPTGCLVIF